MGKRIRIDGKLYEAVSRKPELRTILTKIEYALDAFDEWVEARAALSEYEKLCQLVNDLEKYTDAIDEVVGRDMGSKVIGNLSDVLDAWEEAASDADYEVSTAFVDLGLLDRELGASM